MRLPLTFCRLLFGLGLCLGSNGCAYAAPDPLMKLWLVGSQQSRDSLLSDIKVQETKPPWDRILLLLTQAQEDLQKPALADKRDAIDKAYEAALITETKADDDTVAARIFDGFLMPALRFAPTLPAYQTSRKNLLRSAFTVYQGTNQDDKMKTVLLLLQKSLLDDNTRDWTKLQLGAAYANDQDYSRAIAVFKTVQTPGMKGSVAFLPALHQEMIERDLTAGKTVHHFRTNFSARRKVKLHTKH